MVLRNKAVQVYTAKENPLTGFKLKGNAIRVVVRRRACHSSFVMLEVSLVPGPA